MAMTATALPTQDDIGKHGSWNARDRWDEDHDISGRLLGRGTSRRKDHRNHPNSAYAPRKVHCPACRWTEAYLFCEDNGRYVYVTVGASKVPGEVDLVEVRRLVTAYEVLDKITRRRQVDGGRIESSLLPQGEDMMAQAASFDPAIREVWETRRVF